MRARRRIAQASWIGMSLAVAGCSRASSVTVDHDHDAHDAGAAALSFTATAPDAALAVAPELALHDAGSSALDRLAAEAVTDDDFARRVFYSWTTREQVADLVAGANLLTRQESPLYGISHFDSELDSIVQMDKSDLVARYLRGGRRGLTFRRFAWTTAWPTVLPQGPFPYGDQLLRITLKPDAVLARFAGDGASGAERWSFVTTSGESVSRQEMEAHPERLAAIFHVQHAKAHRYREFVLCNETMIEEWSIGDAAAKGQLEAAADLMRDLAASPPPDAAYDAAIAFERVPPSILPPQDFGGREAKLRAALANQTATLVKRPSLLFDTTAVAFAPPRRPPRGPT